MNDSQFGNFGPLDPKSRSCTTLCICSDSCAPKGQCQDFKSFSRTLVREATSSEGGEDRTQLWGVCRSRWLGFALVLAAFQCFRRFLYQGCLHALQQLNAGLTNAMSHTSYGRRTTTVHFISFWCKHYDQVDARWSKSIRCLSWPMLKKVLTSTLA